MKKLKKILFLILILVGTCLITFFSVFLTYSIKEKRNKNRIYPEFNDKILDNNIKNSCITFLNIIDEDEATSSYYFGASGVIIDRLNNTYYALTAYHVIEKTNKMLVVPYVFCQNNTYPHPVSMMISSFPTFNIEKYIVDYDLALISFEFMGDLDVVNLASNIDSEKISCIGNPDNECFSVHFGEVNLNKRDVIDINDKSFDGYYTNCFVDYGSSGAPILNEKLELVGICIAGVRNDLFKKALKGFFVPIDNILIFLNS